MVQPAGGGGSATRAKTEAKIVFSRGGSWDSAIWTVAADGRRLVRVTHPPKGSGDARPTWSPDHRLIAFERWVRLGVDERGEGTGRGDLMVMTADGRSVRRLIADARGAGPWGGPLWSPDGTRIAFEKKGRIWTIKPDGTEARALAVGECPAWSPEGRQIAFNRFTGDRSEYFVMDASGRNQRRLVPAFTGDTYWRLSWSPIGRQIAFLGSPVVGVDVSLYLVDAAGTHLRKLARGLSSKDTSTAEWSPDGSKLLIERGGRQDSAFVLNAAGGGLRRVATGTDTPEWSPDGRNIVFVKANGNLFVVNANGGSPRRVAQGVNEIDW
ncbi:MAG: TolB family protein [Gaiellaceae bacterium]